MRHPQAASRMAIGQNFDIVVASNSWRSRYPGFRVPLVVKLFPVRKASSQPKAEIAAWFAFAMK